MKKKNLLRVFVDEIFHLTLGHGLILRPMKIEREWKHSCGFSFVKKFSKQNFHPISQTCIAAAIWRFRLHLFSIFPSSEYNSSDVRRNNVLQLFRFFIKWKKNDLVSVVFFEWEEHTFNFHQMTYLIFSSYYLIFNLMVLQKFISWIHWLKSTNIWNNNQPQYADWILMPIFGAEQSVLSKACIEYYYVIKYIFIGVKFKCKCALGTERYLTKSQRPFISMCLSIFHCQCLFVAILFPVRW